MDPLFAASVHAAIRADYRDWLALDADLRVIVEEHRKQRAANRHIALGDALALMFPRATRRDLPL